MSENRSIEILFDKRSVNLPIEKYEELVEKAMMLKTMEKMYFNKSSIYSEDILAAAFGKKEK